MTDIKTVVQYMPRDAAYCDADWRRLLGAAYASVAPFFEPVAGRVTGTYPDKTGNFKYEVRRHGDGWLGVPVDRVAESEDSPWPVLKLDDVRLWRLNEAGWKLAAKLAGMAEGGEAGQVVCPVVYEVGGRFRVEEGCSRVVTVKGGAVWNVPSFTRYVLLVLLTDPREGGLTSEMLHAAAKKLYLSECPEVLDAGKGKGSSIVGVRPLRQYFRITGKNDRKTTHPFFGQITANSTKTPSYYIKKEAVKVRRASD